MKIENKIKDMLDEFYNIFSLEMILKINMNLKLY